MGKMAALAAVASLVLAGVAGAHGAAKFDSEVTISSFVQNRGGHPSGAFFGEIASTNDNCATDRKVKLYRKRPGKDKFLGRRFSDSVEGDWQIPAKGKPGRYYAKVPKVEIPAGICRKDRSEVLKLL